jgi:hypothetical protein
MYGVLEVVPVVKVQVSVVQPAVLIVWAVRQEVSVEPSSALPIWIVLILLFGVEVVPPSFADKVRVYCVFVARVVVVRAYFAPSLAAAVVTTDNELLPTYFWVVLWDKVELPRAVQPVVLLPSSMEPFVTKFAAELVVRSETGLVVSTLSSCAPPLFWTWKAVVVLVAVLTKVSLLTTNVLSIETFCENLAEP